jgi:hypothetical protein
MNDDELRAALVALGVSMGVQRYYGQHKTEAAHEFADKAMKVIELVKRGDAHSHLAHVDYGEGMHGNVGSARVCYCSIGFNH